MAFRFSSVLLVGFLLLQAGGPVRADSPKIQVYEEVEKGFSIGLQAGAAYDFNPPLDTPGLGLLAGLELGYDLTWVFRVKAGFLTEHHSGTSMTSSGNEVTTDFQGRLVWGGASLSLLATHRFYAYAQAGVGYLATSPKRVGGMEVGGKDDVAILVGGGLEYYPQLRHFSFAIETNVSILPLRGDVSIAVFPVVRYTFGLGEVRIIKPPQDRDQDGVEDKLDKCPDTWGSEAQNGCPEPDTDGDGIIDRDDNCPQEPGPASNRGCPIEPDKDGDGLPDKLDRCPEVPGPKESEGCPDRDADGVYDHIDKCPDEPGKPEHDGCPSKAQIKVKVGSKAIQLREKIHFEFGKAVIKKQSYTILDQVAATLSQYPEIKKLQVEGHTDSKGSNKYNQSLSQRRAEAVVAYLVNKGIDKDRLVAKGFGEEKPIASNQTEKGRSVNRRVEMIILEREE
jgi:outer membrane protein OmpA-like peptidoglycan-associated protein